MLVEGYMDLGFSEGGLPDGKVFRWEGALVQLHGFNEYKRSHPTMFSIWQQSCSKDQIMAA